MLVSSSFDRGLYRSYCSGSCSTNPPPKQVRVAESTEPAIWRRSEAHGSLEGKFHIYPALVANRTVLIMDYVRFKMC